MGKKSITDYLPASRVGNIEIQDENQSWKNICYPGEILNLDQKHKLVPYLWSRNTSMQAVALEALVTFPRIHIPILANAFLFLISLLL